MLFLKPFWEPIARGEITVTFRRWKAPHVRAGRRYRTAAGIIQIDSVSLWAERDITDRDARLAGRRDVPSLLADLPVRPDHSLYRIQFHVVDDPDPREELAVNADLSSAEVVEISRRLSRLDQASTHGPWTIPVLEMIESLPGTRAPDLAARFGRETQRFKTDVRKLKSLGLTLSLKIGYRLSPRGEAYLSAIRR
jgi:hypothetical protein